MWTFTNRSLLLENSGGMKMRRVFNILEYGAMPDGGTLCTAHIQSAINDAGRCHGKVIVPPGVYLTGSLFLKTGIEFHLQEGAVLLGTTIEEAYPLLFTRVAGIEMEWPAALINIREQEDVSITGSGKIDGQGEFWWNKYWGQDRKGGMRKLYEEKGLRWAVDYDCTRPRNVLVWKSHNVDLKDFECVRSGFWNVHLCYSSNVFVEGITIRDNAGPSTDGVDVDSCRNVRISGCHISCNDDSVCMKAGRDSDGLKVNKVCENIVVEDCVLGAGSGITLGSETSGGIRNIHIKGIQFNGTSCGFRIKSARTRGGRIEDIQVEDLKMVNVMVPFSFQLDWNPSYSYCEIPKTYHGIIPQHWIKMTKQVPLEQGIPTVRNVTVRNVTAELAENYGGSSKAFDIEGFLEKPMENIRLDNIKIVAKKFGSIKGVKDCKWDAIDISVFE